MRILEAALKYLSAGVAPIPIWRDEKKNPKLTGYKEYTTKLPSQADVTRWFKRWPDANIGLITGYWELCALDFDNPQSFDLWCNQMWNKTCPTWVVSTGRGFHVWFRVTGEVGTSMTYVRNGCEVLARQRGAYCIAPPSIHHTGRRYETVVSAPPMEIDDISEVLTGWSQKVKKKPATASPPSNIQPGHIRIEQLIPIPAGVKPNRQGAYNVTCPFAANHKTGDRNTSAWVNINQQRFGCNGDKCVGPGLWWDTANVYAFLHNISNEEAYQIVMGGQRET